MAADGSMLTLRPVKDGLSREILFADGRIVKTIFKLFDRRLGTVSEDQEGGGISGLFAADDAALSVVYADGRSELLMIGADRTVSIAARATDGQMACSFWFSAGHDFSADERKAAGARFTKPRYPYGELFSQGQFDEPACPQQMPLDFAAVPNTDYSESWNAFDRFYASFIVSHEGGYTDNDGNGRPANYGVNQGANPDIDVLSLDQPRAEQLLYQRYWLASGADQLASPLAMVHGDTAINMGVKAAKELLAQSGGDPGAYLELRDERYRAIAAADPYKANYLSLWLARTVDLRNLLRNGDGTSREPSYAEYPPGFGTAYYRSPCALRLRITRYSFGKMLPLATRTLR
jgi:hypothetical protein